MRSLIGGAVLAAGLLGFTAETAVAGGTPIPDAKLAKTKSGAYQRNNYYAPAGGPIAPQVQVKDVEPGKGTTFFLKIENDGTPGSIEFIAQELGGPDEDVDFQVLKGFKGSNDITAQVQNEQTYAFQAASGATKRFRIKARVDADAETGGTEVVCFDAVTRDDADTEFDVF